MCIHVWYLVSIWVPCTASLRVFDAGSSVLDRVSLVISHSNGSWPRKSKRHLWKKSLNNSPSSTLSTEPHRTTANRTERGVERACKSGLVGEHCNYGWCWEKKMKNQDDVEWMLRMFHSALLCIKVLAMCVQSAQSSHDPLFATGCC